MQQTKLAIRATAEDIANVTTIARAMRATASPFATRTDAIRLALREAAQRATARVVQA